MHAVDPACVLFASLFAYAIQFRTFSLSPRYVWAVLAAVLLCVFLFPRFELYRPRRGESVIAEARDLIYAWIMMGLLAGTALFLTQLAIEFSRLWVGYMALLGFLMQLCIRIVIRVALRSFRRRGLNLRHVVIAGAGSLAKDIIHRIKRQPSSGFHVIAIYDDSENSAGKEISGVPVRGSLELLLQEIGSYRPDRVWIALPLNAEARIRWLVDALREHPIQISFVPDIYSFHLLHHSIAEVAGIPFINLTETPLQGWARALKRIEDLALTIPLLIVLSPLMLSIGLAVKVSSRGPVLYRQDRVTWNGKRFTMLKFRTMPVTAETKSGPVWTSKDDRRATPIGRWMRRFSLDELPQLFNVLAGDMSLVGPRPERPEFVDTFRKQIPGYMQKHLVKAGITGWAQVNDLRGDSDLEKRIQYDLFYIDNWSVWFDLRILLLTLTSVLTSRNAH